MNPYQPSTPRVTFGIAAAAMTVITFALLVIVPTTMDSMGDEVGTVVAASTVVKPTPAVVALTPTPAIVALTPTRFHVINVVAVREPSTSPVRAPGARPKGKQQG
jgi:hypothetical protein